LHVLGGAHQLTQADTLTNGLGQVTATLSATTPGERKIVAVVRGLEVALADTALVQFNAVPQTADSLLYVDGNNQTAAAGEWLARPLQVRVVNELGLALRGYPVHFRVGAGGGQFSNGLDSVTIASDTLGLAQVFLRLGGVAGIANQNVQVWAEHAQNAPLLFTANATSAAAASLVKVSGDSQKVMPGAVVPLPLRVRLLDQFGNSVPFSPVTFIAPQGGVILDPQPCISDTNGYAETRIGAPAVSGTHIYQAVLGSGSAAVFALEVLKPNQPPQILAYDPAEPHILGYYDQTLQFRLTSVRDADGDSLYFRWLVNGQEKSTTADLSFIPRFIDGKDYEVVAWLKDGVDSTSVRWQVAVTLTGLCESRGQLPATLQLRQNYPNPFNPTTQMRLEVPAAKQISLRIYNVQGQLVRTLCDAVLAPGYHTMIWDARTEAGQTVPSGIYHAVLLAEDQRQIIRLLLMK